MSKFVLAVVTAVFFNFCFVGAGYADAMSDLATQIQSLQGQMQAQAKLIESLQQQVQGLRAEKVKPVAIPRGATEEERNMLERLADGMLPTKKGEWLQIGGELELEYVDAAHDNNGAREVSTAVGGTESEGQFQIDKFVLETKANFSEDIYWLQKLEFAPSNSPDTNTVDIDNSYVMIKNVVDHFGISDPTDTYISLGVQDPFEKRSRILENYNLLGTAFHRDEQLGIQMGGHWKSLYWRSAVSNSNELSDRSPNDDSSDFEIVEDNEQNFDEDTNKEISFGLGFDHDFGDLGAINLLGFYNIAHLSEEDVAFLQTISGYSGNFSDEINIERGIRLDYSLAGLRLHGMLINAQDGLMDRQGYAFEISYLLDLPGTERNGRKFLTGVRPVYEYSQLNVGGGGLNPNPIDARTWDRGKHVIGVVTDVSKNMKLKLEYAINDEETGNQDVNNNEWLGQLELKF
jgi:hypothetical protein